VTTQKPHQREKWQVKEVQGTA